MEFAYGFWQEYSAISHATFQGLPQIGIFLAPKVWKALIPVPEIKKLYDRRFCKLMEEKGIFPD